MLTAMFPGTFDPMTLGHEDLIARAANMYEKVWVAVAESSGKNPLLTLEERMTLAKEVLATHANVDVCALTGLLVDCARSKNVQVILRSARNSVDFNAEWQMASANAQLQPGLETVLILPKLTLAGISSTLVREIGLLGGDVSAFVSPKALRYLTQHKKVVP